MKVQTGKRQAGQLTIVPVFIGQSFDQLGLQLNEYHGKVKDHAVFFDREGTRYAVIGMGAAAKFELNKLRNAVGFGARAARKEEQKEVTVLLPEGTNFTKEELVHATVEGFLLGDYQFVKYKKKFEAETVETVTIATVDGELTGLDEVVKKATVYSEGTCIARDLKNEPTNKMRPYDLVDYVQELFKGTDAQVEVFKGDDLAAKKFNGIIAVGKGSKNPGAMIKISYQTDASQELTALVGKGLTYDSGGVSLKIARDLSDMRMDMGGSAAVVGAMYILTRLGVKANIVALIPTCENLLDANSMLPGEIIEYANGMTVQVGNTDAEGRLVLADALLYSQELGAKRVVDIATLTGACLAALGKKYAGLFGEESVVSGIKKSAYSTGEKVWELPLADEYEELLYSAYADVRNIAEGPFAGAITAALFLRRFVGAEQKWAHIDMAGPMDVNRVHTYSNEGATGFGARLLADFIIG
ncbi:leucyl aminopeptidase family protein [Tumebacillus sp. DT12]|uniref:Probable cytosol aminopeptidase n=1 Tax=Tumebacillus lacus TaxID=2995335 RepID=A0ABT3WWI7_9BACL|nr:leucyl aminopeptidase family protein [Tumebacillus lacus]MCX7569042.1 leucyl aminopeptidase family protein [Tumebacillus lacus]